MVSVGLVTFDENYYYSEYAKYNVGTTQSLNEKDLHFITKNVLEYLSDRRDNLDFAVNRDKAVNKDYFSDRDKSHMKDVKKIYMGLWNLAVVSSIILAVSLFIAFRKPKYKESIHRFLGIGAILGIIPIVILAVLMAVDFNKYFIIFHQIFFTNDLWLLDPQFDNLVNIFPEEFFLDMAVRICSGYIIGLLAILVLSFARFKKIRRT